MTEIIVYYQNADASETGTIPVFLGETYQTAQDFVREFLANHPNYTVVKIKEVA